MTAQGPSEQAGVDVPPDPVAENMQSLVAGGAEGQDLGAATRADIGASFGEPRSSDGEDAGAAHDAPVTMDVDPSAAGKAEAPEAFGEPDVMVIEDGGEGKDVGAAAAGSGAAGVPATNGGSVPSQAAENALPDVAMADDALERPSTEGLLPSEANGDTATPSGSGMGGKGTMGSAPAASGRATSVGASAGEGGVSAGPGGAGAEAVSRPLIDPPYVDPAAPPPNAITGEPGSPLAVMEGLLAQLCKIDSAKVFYMPVTEVVAPQYYTIIKRPMSFAQMAARLRSNGYATWGGFYDDFELICKNAMTYNHKRSRVHKHAQNFMRGGKKLLQARELEARKALGALAPPGAAEKEEAERAARLAAEAAARAAAGEPPLGEGGAAGDASAPATPRERKSVSEIFEEALAEEGVAEAIDAEPKVLGSPPQSDSEPEGDGAFGSEWSGTDDEAAAATDAKEEAVRVAAGGAAGPSGRSEAAVGWSKGLSREWKGYRGGVQWRCRWLELRMRAVREQLSRYEQAEARAAERAAVVGVGGAEEGSPSPAPEGVGEETAAMDAAKPVEGAEEEIKPSEAPAAGAEEGAAADGDGDVAAAGAVPMEVAGVHEGAKGAGEVGGAEEPAPEVRRGKRRRKAVPGREEAEQEEVDKLLEFHPLAARAGKPARRSRRRAAAGRRRRPAAGPDGWASSSDDDSIVRLYAKVDALHKRASSLRADIYRTRTGGSEPPDGFYQRGCGGLGGMGSPRAESGRKRANKTGSLTPLAVPGVRRRTQDDGSYSTPVVARRRGDAGQYDIENVVMPTGMMGGPKYIERVQHEFISTPGVRPAGGGQQRWAARGTGGADGADGSSSEDTSDEAYVLRHMRYEEQEKERYMSFTGGGAQKRERDRSGGGGGGGAQGKGGGQMSGSLGKGGGSDDEDGRSMGGRSAQATPSIKRKGSGRGPGRPPGRGRAGRGGRPGGGGGGGGGSRGANGLGGGLNHSQSLPAHMMHHPDLLDDMDDMDDDGMGRDGMGLDTPSAGLGQNATPGSDVGGDVDLGNSSWGAERREGGGNVLVLKRVIP